MHRTLVESKRAAPPSLAPPSLAPAVAAPATPPATSPAPAQTAQAAGAQESGAVASLQGRIRAAIQAALRYPPAAVAMQLTGRAQVQLEYRSGGVREVLLTRSAGSPLLDRAAISAVRDARYPAAPPEVGDRPLLLLVWVELTAA